MTEHLIESSAHGVTAQAMEHWVARMRQHGVLQAISEIESGQETSPVNDALEAEYLKYNRITELEAEIARAAHNKKIERERKLQEARNFIYNFQKGMSEKR